MVATLRKGRTGAEILDILEAITGVENDTPETTTVNTGTLEPIEFWHAKVWC